MDDRQKIIQIAREYIGTPYHPCARVKGAGVDCLTLLSGVWEDAGFIEKADIPHYSPQFMLHRSDELYLGGLEKYAKEITVPKPAGIAIWKFGRCFSHAAIITEWPMIIHAYVGKNVQEEDVSITEWLKFMADGKTARPVKFFDFWGDA